MAKVEELGDQVANKIVKADNDENSETEKSDKKEEAAKKDDSGKKE